MACLRLAAWSADACLRLAQHQLQIFAPLGIDAIANFSDVDQTRGRRFSLTSVLFRAMEWKIAKV